MQIDFEIFQINKLQALSHIQRYSFEIYIYVYLFIHIYLTSYAKIKL